MTNIEGILFIGKCLTLSQYPYRIPDIKGYITSGRVNWELIVWQSTSQFVFPALYLQLKWAELLHELPSDLVEYMEDITNINRERNRQIIEQALEISDILNQAGISSVFLKGTAHLLDGLYEDIAERMVSDIDLLVSEQDMEIAANILIKTGYEPVEIYDPCGIKFKRHYPQLLHKDKFTGVEIHKHIIRFPDNRSIDCQILIENSKKNNFRNSAYILCERHQIVHNILNAQVNDYAYHNGNIFLRQIYDLFYLSLKADPLLAIKNFGIFFHPMNANLALANKILGAPLCMPYEVNWQARISTYRTLMVYKYPNWGRLPNNTLFLIVRLIKYSTWFVLAISNRDMRQYLLGRLGNLCCKRAF